ncbi:RNA polymerase sigma factor [Rurimicrobium arvi]|uniref:RNA polymerase sigma factor n=2 Tax=Rurimicrobium arvi TaxID=2049916 RepID=A0ABP8MXZ6_9BACT
MIDGCMKNNPFMQKSLYYAYYPLLMRIGIRYAPAREDAEQWVQDAFLKIFDQLHTYQYLGSFEGWIRKIMVRLCIDRLRAHHAQSQVITESVDPEDPSWEAHNYVENEFISKTSAEDLLRMITALADRQKLVFNLIVFEAYTYKEVAALLNITENHTYLLLHQARKQLKAMMTQQSELQKVSYEQR